VAEREDNVTEPEAAPGRAYTADEIQAWLIARIIRALDRPSADVRADTELTRLGLESIVAVRISGELETLLGRPVDPMLLWDYPTVAAVATHLAAGRPESGSP
jgi:8-amino-7-oxononanoate synthase